jgi:hypothetical protein
MSTLEGTRVPPTTYDDLPPAAKTAHDGHTRVARITNMKRTLLHSVPAFDALMTWYPLRDKLQPFLGERLTTLFAHAVSSDTDCLICSTFFRRLLVQSGEDPDRLVLDDWESPVVAFGRSLAVTPHTVPDPVYQPIAERLSRGRARFADRLTARIDGVINHCRYPLNTGFLEGINNKIKVLKRMAYGFRDHEYFFLKIRAAFPGIPR